MTQYCAFCIKRSSHPQGRVTCRSKLLVFSSVTVSLKSKVCGSLCSVSSSRNGC
ncbi:Uncharacterised protein [Vibrio cholerae]|nr:Uncharacterised protein [Vibrio cholerae]